MGLLFGIAAFFEWQGHNGWSDLWKWDVPLAEHGGVKENAAVAAVHFHDFTYHPAQRDVQ